MDVSISFAFVTPMRILPPMFAPAVNVPLTTRLSSIVVVPPAESMIKLPDEVSISLLAVTPICIRSIEAPPLKSARPVM